MFTQIRNITIHSLTKCLAIVLVCLSSWAMAQEDTTATEGYSPELLAEGELIFKGQCASCHNLTDQIKTGPGFYGVFDRVPSREWMYDWIRNSQALIASGDDYANKIYLENNKTLMQAFAFEDSQIEAVLAYIETNASLPDDVVGGGGGDTTATTASGGGNFTLILGILLFVLILMLLVLAMMLTILTGALKNKDDLQEEEEEVVNQSFPVIKFLQSKAFVGAVVLIFFLVGAKAVTDEVVGIGIQQGYAPTQPIPFSHKLHAGNYEIECEYCHTGVRKGKSATIPSANICMNCHNQVKRTSPLIQKIYKAIERDKPIEWVRVHNLQDFVYFNHSQHVVVGGLECEQCHGDIEQMEVVQQRAPLTMGWCINCHRETVVKAEGNAYYDKLLEAHKGATGKKDMKVEDIGGLECGKCHY